MCDDFVQYTPNVDLVLKDGVDSYDNKHVVKHVIKHCSPMCY